MNTKIFLLLLSLLSSTAWAGQISKVKTLDTASHTLSQVTGRPVRLYSTRDFGRDNYPDARSILIQQSEAEATLQQVRKTLPAGFVAFIGTTHSLAKPKPEGVELVVGPGENQFAILRIAASDAVNYGKSTEQLIKKLQEWDSLYGIDIWQAETDVIQLNLKTLPPDLAKFAREVYEFCPDIVDQGTETVEILEQEIRKYKSVYLWWD